MLKFIWNSWWRNKERFLLLIVGALIVSIGLSYLVGITQASNGTIVDELQKRWKSSYHIVVRPPDSRSVTEDKNLLEPNYLSGLSGGISMEQYEQIKTMTDIDVAAPIAMMGYIQNSVLLDKVNYTESGIYRMNIKESTNTGVDTVVDDSNIYFTVGWQPPGSDQSYGVTRFMGDLSYGTNILLAGIDPEAEAALVGIDEAMVGNEYLNETDQTGTSEHNGITETNVPVIISNQEFVDGNITYTFEKLDIPSFLENPESTMEEVKEQGGQAYLDKIDGEQVDQFLYTTEDTHQKIVEQVSDGTGTVSDSLWMPFKPSSVEYREVTSPYGERWPFTYEVEPFIIPEDSLLAVNHSYRPVSMFGESSDAWPRLQLDFKGVFDPSKLDISKDPLTELPMETYFPSKADWVLDQDNQPVNPPQQMKPLNNPYGFLTKPPLMLTTLEAAAEVLGEQPISAIRIKVKGVEELNEESEVILQDVADQIEEETGLITDITLGSSPQPALTHIPGVGEEESLGWIEQPWIKLGSSVTIFKESKVGMAGVIGSVILVAIVYVFSSNIIMTYARKKEFAVLLSLGWRPNQLTKLLFIEAMIIGLFVSMISWFILGLIYVMDDIQTSILRFLLIGLFGILIYVLGAFIPGLLVRKISPYETMKTGEISKQKRYFKTRFVFAMSLNNLLVKWKRSVLSIIAIALPTSLLIFFLFITFRLRGIMYTTWLGEYVAMEVGPMHYIAMGVAIAIAILTTAEIIWQNVSERQPELAVLKALGWQNKAVRRLVLYEGALSGFIAGIIGVGIAYLIVWGMYGQFPYEQLPFFAATIILPIITGILGAILPASKAVKIQPYQGMGGSYGTSKKTEKGFQYTLGILGASLFIGIIVLLAQAIPDVQQASGSQPEETNVEGTSGEVINTISSSDIEIETIVEEDTEELKNELSSQIQSIIENDNVDEILTIGETWTKDLDYGRTIKYDLESTPDGVVSQEKDTKLITISVDVIYKDIDKPFEGLIQYQPHVGGYYLLDEKGNKYERIHYELVEEENWNRIYLKAPGKMSSLLTYEVPEDVEKLILVDYQPWVHSWPDQEVIVDIFNNVKITLETDDQASNDDKQEQELSSNLMQETIDNAFKVTEIGIPLEGTTETFTYNLAETPNGIVPKSENTELITISNELISIAEGGGYQYGPHLGLIKLIDEKGNTYTPVDTTVIESENWDKIYLKLPGRIKTLLTYEVPKDSKSLILLERHSWIPRSGSIVVIVK